MKDNFQSAMEWKKSAVDQVLSIVSWGGNLKNILYDTYTGFNACVMLGWKYLELTINYKVY